GKDRARGGGHRRRHRRAAYRHPANGGAAHGEARGAAHAARHARRAAAVRIAAANAVLSVHRALEQALARARETRRRSRKKAGGKERRRRVNAEEFAICQRRGHKPAAPAIDGWVPCEFCGIWLREVRTVTIETREDQPPEDEQNPLYRLR